MHTDYSRDWTYFGRRKRMELRSLHFVRSYNRNLKDFLENAYIK